MTAEIWGKLLLWFGLCAGNAKLWVEFVNRTHAGRLSCGALHRLRMLHDVALLVFPLLIAGSLLGSGDGSPVFPQLHLSGLTTPVTVQVVWQGYLGSCLFGLFWLAWSAGQHLATSIPAPHILKSSEVFDVTRQLGFRPNGCGIHPRLALAPLNEQFKVEFSRKEFFLPVLPREIDGLKILHLSDWHIHGTVDLPYYQYVVDLLSRERADLVVFTGDLLDDMNKLDWIPQTLGRLSGTAGQYFILGNHDWYLQPDQIRRTLASCGWTDVSSRVLTIPIRGGKLRIGGDETPWMGSAPVFGKDSECDFSILLSHTPDNFPRAVREGVPLVLAGHNHGGQVKLPIIGPVYSPSKFSTRYASGEFVVDGTVMHVSRGLSGRHPYRFNCLPEVTMITLKTEPKPVNS